LRSRRPFAVSRRYLQFGASNYPFRFELRNGLSLDLNGFHDLVTAWIVFFRNEYRIPPNVQTILDLGANIGCFSLRSAFDIPSVRVIALEPFPSTFERLVANIRNHVVQDRIQSWKLGVAARSQSRRMAIGGPSQSICLLAEEAGVADNRLEVSVVTLEEALERACAAFGTETVDFVKMDIEGAEHETILATSPAALRRIRCLGMEYHPNQPKAPLFDHLIAAGFDLQHDWVIGRDVGVAHFHR